MRSLNLTHPRSRNLAAWLVLIAANSIAAAAQFQSANAQSSTASTIGDVSGCSGSNCVEVTIGENRRLFSEVHVLSDAEMPPMEFRQENFFGTIKQAIARVRDDGVVYIHNGEFSEEINLKRPANITIAAYGNNQVTLTPAGECLNYQPWFQQDKPEPKIILRGLTFKPKHLGEGSACISVAASEFVLEDVAIHLPPSNRAAGIHAHQGVVSLKNSALIGHAEATESTGLIVAPTSTALLNYSIVNGFATGIDVAGGLQISNDSEVTANGTGVLISTEEARDPNLATIQIRDSYIETEDMSLARASATMQNSSQLDLVRYGIEFTGGFSSSAVVENVSFQGDGMQSGGVIVSGGSLGKITVKSSSFDGFAQAVSVNGSIILDSNVFGKRAFYGRNSNGIAIGLESRFYDTKYEVRNNEFIYNDQSFQIGPDFTGAIHVSGNIGEVQKRGKLKINVAESLLPKEARLTACEIEESSQIEKELLSKLGKLEACQLYRQR